jgi:Ca2+:H+ antiporter
MKPLLKPSLNWLLVFVPVAIALRIWPRLENETALFVCSCVAVVPLASWMGRATEELAEHLGHGAGGLLSATFVNAAELGRRAITQAETEKQKQKIDYGNTSRDKTRSDD